MKRRIKYSTLLLCATLCLSAAASRPARAENGLERETAAKKSFDELISSVRALGLGEESFVIGSYLSPEQIKWARGSLLTDTYPGTIKFASGEVVVVADGETYLTLAVYKRREEAGTDAVERMVGHLMNRFGEPTTMAHGKLIYWAYGEAGKIDTEAWDEARAVGMIDVLATVKFSSSLEVKPGMADENMENTGTIYYIITSDRLLGEYVTDP